MIVGISMKTSSQKIGINPHQSIYSLPSNLYDSLMESRQERLCRGYELLVRHIPNLKARLVDQDVLELNNYFRDVSLRPVQRKICTHF
jgi:hypothetical protein